MSLNYVALTCDLFDGQGNALNGGTATFTPSVQLTDAADHEIITLAPVTASFKAAASPVVSLLATDNGNPLPGGWAWTVTFSGVPGNPAAFSFFLPFTGGASQNLSALSPVSGAVTQFPSWPGTALGDTVYGGASPAGVPARLAGNTSTTPEMLTSTGTGSAATAPAWQSAAALGLTPLDLNELLIAPTGATGETCPRSIATATSSLSLVSGDVYVRAIGLRSGIAVNNVTLFTGTQATGGGVDLTHGWYALLDSGFVVRAVSADQAAASTWSATNTKYTLSVAGAGYTTTYTGIYYIAVSASVSASTMPSFATSTGPANSIIAATAPFLWGISQALAAPPTTGTALTALTTPNVVNSNVFYAYTS